MTYAPEKQCNENRSCHVNITRSLPSVPNVTRTHLEQKRGSPTPHSSRLLARLRTPAIIATDINHESIT